MPRYETGADLNNEESVAKLFCLSMNCSYKKIREIDDYCPDVSFWRKGERVAIGEIKCRTCAKDTYPTYMISKAKVDGIVERWSPTPAFLIVRWRGDGIWWVKLDSIDNWRVANGGRKDRGNPKDIEQCYHIQIAEFRPVRMNEIHESEIA